MLTNVIRLSEYPDIRDRNRFEIKYPSVQSGSFGSESVLNCLDIQG